MKTIFRFTLILLFAFSWKLKAQVKNVKIETYYISDSKDATDTTGSILPPHSTTYRIFVQIAPGCMVTRVFGDQYHQLMFASDSVFYNHTADGQTFANKFNYAHFSEGTLPLDTWLTIGQVSVTKPTGRTYFGTPKNEDRDGSIVGGPHSDGGSAGVPGGILMNNDSGAGIPLTSEDGLDTMSYSRVPATGGWLNFGFLNSQSIDSTIFGSVVKKNIFSSNNAFLQCSGVGGINRDSNQVLIAQLTTNGNIRFTLNVDVYDSVNHIVYRSVAATDPSDSLNTVNGSHVDPKIVYVQSPYLNYPLICGCNDPNYLEYNPMYGCLDSSACKTLAVIGCMDTMACNYDPAANLNVQALCCYPGLCQDRDISIVCPTLNVNELRSQLQFDISPNPASELLSVEITSTITKPLGVEIIDLWGRSVLKQQTNSSLSGYNLPIDVSGLASGLYLILISDGAITGSKKFVKY